MAVNGPLTVDDVDLVIGAALDGVGLASLAEEHAESRISRTARSYACCRPGVRRFPGTPSTIRNSLVREDKKADEVGRE